MRISKIIISQKKENIMVAKKKGLCLGLLLLLLGMGNVIQAKISIMNLTRHKMKFEIEFHGNCSKIEREVRISGVRSLFKTECRPKRVRAVLLVPSKLSLFSSEYTVPSKDHDVLLVFIRDAEANRFILKKITKEKFDNIGLVLQPGRYYSTYYKGPI